MTWMWIAIALQWGMIALLWRRNRVSKAAATRFAQLAITRMFEIQDAHATSAGWKDDALRYRDLAFMVAKTRDVVRTERDALILERNHLYSVN